MTAGDELIWAWFIGFCCGAAAILVIVLRTRTAGVLPSEKGGA